MKNITTYLSKHGALALMASMFLFASCSKQTAYVSQYDKLAYEQTVKPQASEEMAQIPAEINPVESNTEMAAAPMLENEKIRKNEVPDKRKTKAAIAFNKVKEKAPKAIKNITAENLASVSLLASAAKGKNKSAIEGGNYLKIGIVLILIGLLVGIIFSQLGYIISVIGVIFIVLWLIGML